MQKYCDKLYNDIEILDNEYYKIKNELENYCDNQFVNNNIDPYNTDFFKSNIITLKNLENNINILKKNLDNINPHYRLIKMNNKLIN